MKIFSIFLIGVVILIGAILLNGIAKELGIKTWYDFLTNPKSTSFLSYLWLMIIYPLGLGILGYVASNFLTPSL
jgi:hypothetical protein